MTAALLCQLEQGDHVVAARAAFGSCRWLTDSLLPKVAADGCEADLSTVTNCGACGRTCPAAANATATQFPLYTAFINQLNAFANTFVKTNRSGSCI